MNPRGVAWAAKALRPPSSASGLLTASASFGASVVPSLYPRPWSAQAVVSGIALAAGYGLGAAAGRLARGTRRASPRRGSLTARRAAWVAVGVLAAGMCLSALALNYWWQLDVRALMGIDGSPGPYLLSVSAASLASGYALVVVGRLASAGRDAYVRLRSRRLPPRGPASLRLLVALVLLVLFLDWGVGGRVFPAVQASLVAADASSDPGVRPTMSPHRSGGPGSLVAWEDLGRMGRRFVAGGPDATELAAFAGTTALSPIRVYVGLGSAESERERAELAVAELERTGAFEREVLVIVTPTGTGAVNEFAIDPLELMYAGDTAAVATQYSLAPSWMTMAGNQERAERGARELFDAVAHRLARRPAASRPKVLLYGESLGSFGSESVVARAGEIPEEVFGALWVGPPSVNRLRRQLTESRDDRSPVWEPTHRGAAGVRFAADATRLPEPGSPWERPRVAYLQHASDPVVWWGADLLLRRPEWLEEPRGPDVSSRMPYLPVVTFLQTGLDMVLGGNAPPGHGHMYGPEHAEAWAAIAPPPGWSREATARLRAAVEEATVVVRPRR